MKNYIIFLTLFLVSEILFSCSNSTKNNDTSTLNNADSLSLIKEDSFSTIQGDSSEIEMMIIESIDTPDIYTRFDLKTFKSASKSSHSSPANLEDYYYEIDDFGHYSYFYFLEHHYINRKSEYPNREDFYIVSAMKNEFTGDEQYMEMQEELAVLQCKIQDPNLGDWNFVGKKIQDLDNLDFGSIILDSSTLRVYGFEDLAFSFLIMDESIKGFRYIRFSSNIESLKDSLGNGIFEF